MHTLYVDTYVRRGTERKVAANEYRKKSYCVVVKPEEEVSDFSV